jgi:hypothetical protein
MHVCVAQSTSKIHYVTSTLHLATIPLHLADCQYPIGDELPGMRHYQEPLSGGQWQ